MKRYDELTARQQVAAREKCTDLLLTAIVEGRLRFNDNLNGGNLQDRIDTALFTANAKATPWFAGEYVMGACREELDDMARCDAEHSLYSSPEERILDGIIQ